MQVWISFLSFKNHVYVTNYTSKESLMSGDHEDIYEFVTFCLFV